jgi:hypothetical protein
MPTTTDELALARSYIGTTETDDDFNARFDRLYAEITTANSDTLRRSQALRAATEESLRAQLASMTLDGPGSASAEGMAYSNGQNMIELDKLLSSVVNKGIGVGSGQVNVVKVRRQGGR